jgi:sarcosine oxidase, subunit beta
MTETADVVVIGAGVQGASLAFQLARRGVDVLVIERSAVAAGATGRSSGFVRMHYDLESESRLAWLSYPYFRNWEEMVGSGDCGFVQTGFVQLVPPDLAGSLRENVTMQQRLGIDVALVGGREVAEIFPGIVADDIEVAAWEPSSGYADPSGTAAGFLGAARVAGARLLQGRRVTAVTEESGRVTGVDTDAGRIDAAIVVIAAGAWAGELAATVGLEVPVVPWRHDTAFFGLPPGRGPDFPIVIDSINEAYFRPEGRDLMLVGSERDSEIGGLPDRPMAAANQAGIEVLIDRVCRRVPWIADGSYRGAWGGQDGLSPDQRAILGPAGPQGLYLCCGFSGTGFKTAPAVGACLAELILDGRTATADISAYSLDRFAEGRLLVGPYPYGDFWR